MGQKPDDIPQDIWEAAIRALHDAVEPHQDGIAINRHTIDVMILGAASAILAERERCAMVAETFDGPKHLFFPGRDDDLPKGWPGCRRTIAAAIREGGQP